MSSIIDLLIRKIVEFVERDYMEEEVRVEIIGKPPKVPLHEGFTELSRGAEYNVPRWLAKLLVEDNIARIRDEALTIEKLSSIAYNEESLVKKLQLIKIPRYFYMMVREELEKLNEKLRRTADISVLEDYKQIDDLYVTIGRIRVKKLLNFLLLPSVPSEVFDKMSEEEKIMFNILRETLLTWMKKLRLGKT